MQRVFKAALATMSFASLSLFAACGSQSEGARQQAPSAPRLAPPPPSVPTARPQQPTPAPTAVAQPAPQPASFRHVAGLYRPLQSVQVLDARGQDSELLYFLITGSGVIGDIFKLHTIHQSGSQLQIKGPRRLDSYAAPLRLNEGKLTIPDFSRTADLALSLDGMHLSEGEMNAIADQNLHRLARLASLVPVLNEQLNPHAFSARIELKPGLVRLSEAQVRLAQALIAEPAKLTAYLSARNLKDILFTNEACLQPYGLCIAHGKLVVGADVDSATPTAELIRFLERRTLALTE